MMQADANILKTKMLIELSETVEDADGYIESCAGISDVKAKLDFLHENFEDRVVGRNGEDIHADYIAILTVIINRKWR